MHQWLALLKNGRKLVFLSFINVEPQKLLTLTPLVRCRNHLLEWNDMHKFKGLMMMIKRGG
jgi:hypothetical protein